MILRPADYDDCEFIADAFKQWPRTPRGRVFPVDVRNWVNKYNRGDEVGLVGEVDGQPVGFVVYASNLFVARVGSIVVHPDHQGRGYSSAMLRLVHHRLMSEGVVVIEFEAIPGVIADKTLKGQYQKVGEGIGSQTGLPTVIGRATAETKI